MSKRTAHRAAKAAAVLFSATAITCARADVTVFTDHFNNGNVANSDSQTNFWSTLVSGGGTATEGTGGAGSLLLNVTGASSNNRFPFTEIASPLQSSFNFFRAPMVIQASGLNYGAGTDPTSLTQFTITTQALSNAGPNTEFPASDAISLWVANPDNVNGQILLGLKQDSPNASSAFDRFQAIGPVGRDTGPVFYGAQVRAIKLVIGPTFYSLQVSHDSSPSDPTQVLSTFSGGLDINRGAGPGWGTATNPLGDNAVNIETQLSGVSDPTAVAPFNTGSLSVSQFVTDYLGTGTGNWSDGNNWDNADVPHPNGDNTVSNVPNFVGANVNFGPAAAPTVVLTDHDQTLGAITLNSAQPYTITVTGNGEGTIHLATRYAFGEVTDLNGNHTIFSPIFAHNDAVFTVTNASNTLTVPTIIAENPGTLNFTKNGAGKLVTSNVLFNNLAINGGTLAMLNSGTASGVSNVKTLTIGGGSGAWTAAWDLSNNAAIVDYTGTSPLATIADQIKSGRGNGAWNGTGITSSAAAAVASDSSNIHKTALGFAEASLLSFNTYQGQSLDGSAVFVRYTFTGDANLDGAVTTADFTSLATNFNQSGKSWIDGDFNYDGKVNALDFNAVATNFGQTMSSASLGTLVPEPMCVSMILGGALLLRRRSKQTSTVLRQLSS
jgi:dockerin type I repeat protein